LGIFFLRHRHRALTPVFFLNNEPDIKRESGQSVEENLFGGITTATSRQKIFKLPLIFATTEKEIFSIDNCVPIFADIFEFEFLNSAQNNNKNLQLMNLDINIKEKIRKISNKKILYKKKNFEDYSFISKTDNNSMNDYSDLTDDELTIRLSLLAKFGTESLNRNVNVYNVFDYI